MNRIVFVAICLISTVMLMFMTLKSEPQDIDNTQIVKEHHQ